MVLDAVIRSESLYGSESAQIILAQQRRIEIFQLNGLRQILKLTATYVERANMNAAVFRKANDAIRNETLEGKAPKLVKPFVTCYLNSRMKRLARI